MKSTLLSLAVCALGTARAMPDRQEALKKLSKAITEVRESEGLGDTGEGGMEGLLREAHECCKTQQGWIDELGRWQSHIDKTLKFYANSYSNGENSSDYVGAAFQEDNWVTRANSVIYRRSSVKGDWTHHNGNALLVFMKPEILKGKRIQESVKLLLKEVAFVVHQLDLSPGDGQKLAKGHNVRGVEVPEFDTELLQGERVLPPVLVDYWERGDFYFKWTPDAAKMAEWIDYFSTKN